MKELIAFWVAIVIGIPLTITLIFFGYNAVDHHFDSLEQQEKIERQVAYDKERELRLNENYERAYTKLSEEFRQYKIDHPAK